MLLKKPTKMALFNLVIFSPYHFKLMIDQKVERSKSNEIRHIVNSKKKWKHLH